MITTHLIFFGFFEGATPSDAPPPEPTPERTVPDGGGGRHKRRKRVQVRGKWYSSDDTAAIRRALNEWVREVESRQAPEPKAAKAPAPKVVTLPTVDDTPDIRIPVMVPNLLAHDELRQFQRTLRLLQVQEQAIRALMHQAELEDDEDAMAILFQ
jgi:hypothetical protein